MIDAVQLLLQFNIIKVQYVYVCTSILASFRIYLKLLNLEISNNMINKKLLLYCSCISFIPRPGKHCCLLQYLSEVSKRLERKKLPNTTFFHF